MRLNSQVFSSSLSDQHRAARPYLYCLVNSKGGDSVKLGVNIKGVQSDTKVVNTIKLAMRDRDVWGANTIEESIAVLTFQKTEE